MSAVSRMHTPERQRARAEAQLSRRNLLGGLGLGIAGTVFLGPGAMAHAAESRTLAVPAGRFGRMFPDLPPFMPANDATRTAMSAMSAPGGLLDANDDLAAGPIELIIDPDLSLNNRDNPTHTAGTTFFGQFLDHDMTFDTTSPLGFPTPPEDSPNARTPAFDLDSVYGGGPAADPELYQPDLVRLRIESGGLFEDLPLDQRQPGDHRGSPKRRERHHLRPAGCLHPVPQRGRGAPAGRGLQRRPVPGGPADRHLALPVDHRA
jgi:hypothetical protein